MLSYPSELRAMSLDRQCHLHVKIQTCFGTFHFGAAMEEALLEEGLDVQTGAHPHQYRCTVPLTFSCIS